MAKLNIYKGQLFNSSDWESQSLEDRIAVRNAITNSLLPKFASGVFEIVASTSYNHGGQGLKGQFGKVSLLADGCGGRFMVSLHRGADMITFGSCTEQPFGHFRKPSLTSYYGSAADWSQMIDQVAQGLKRAKKEGRHPLQPSAVLAKMFALD